MQLENNKEIPAVNNLVEPQQWVHKYADYLYTFAFNRTNDEELSRDLVQETFLAALQGMNKFEGRSTESTWLTAILKNKIIDVYRRKSSGLINRKDAEFEQHNFFDQEDGHWNDAYRPQLFGIEHEDPVLNKEFIHFLQMCMQKLPSLWLSVFTMKHMDDESTKTICSELNVTPANFWVIIHRTKVNLRACLQKNWM
ncbi:sigma-70 family RNA polymerase sigma factor [Chitinophaga oryziterrae]|uniref:Sigma-70 family RNA polymerase sigma factor n=1 Tax=Chitinophaga oryziterrae TaxID=1031224 RepID=A0A6N8J8V5_9BACT|nr:sigma-70 family RNA polymerase sigma factor [Chitinophaga oryziterrae]MVT41667.1 sigma-70 family RNA polymerase sigma factor [Chitinophaga oryziterrae]